MSKIAIIDYGMANLDSIARAIEKCGGTPAFGRQPADIADADKLILPGVGAFPRAMHNLREQKLVEPLRDFARHRPMLGICLGMQLLATRGTEIEETPGLGLIDGTIERLDIPQPLRVPHTGWNELSYMSTDPLFDGIPAGKDFYFVHSYQFVCANSADLLATTNYSSAITAAIRHNSLYGVQFHPEKSQQWGLRLLRNFMEM